MIKRRLTVKLDQLKEIWQQRQTIDWKQWGCRQGKSLVRFFKRAVIYLPTAAGLIVWNILFRLLYHLPFVNKKAIPLKPSPITIRLRKFLKWRMGFSSLSKRLRSCLTNGK